MTNNDVDFETWCSSVEMLVLDATGVEFSDLDSVRSDYEQGLDATEVAHQIINEYGGME